MIIRCYAYFLLCLKKKQKKQEEMNARMNFQTYYIHLCFKHLF